MSLIKCPECGKEISDKATVCIHCGYPIKEETDKINIEQNTKKFCISVHEFRMFIYAI